MRSNIYGKTHLIGVCNQKVHLKSLRMETTLNFLDNNHEPRQMQLKIV
jgi:hypothetical protein